MRVISIAKKTYRPKITWDAYYHRWNVTSETYDTHQYAVHVQHIDSSLVCNCPWGRGRARAAGKKCKHVVAVEAWLEALTPEQKKEYI